MKPLDTGRHLHRLLVHYNGATRLRLRAAVHEEVVSQAANGFAGQAVVQVRRLLSCSAMRKTLKAPETMLALIVTAPGDAIEVANEPAPVNGDKGAP
ncbi:hypothetical protein [Nonomuraea sp. NPDC002799]